MSRASKFFSYAAIVAAALFAAVSCVNTDSTLGASYVPSNQDISIHIAEFDLPVGQKYCDSLQTTVSQQIAVGSITDKYGTVTVGTAVTITPETDSIIWGTSPIFKSMYASLTLSSTQVLESSQNSIPQNIYVHQLKVELDTTRVYNNSISLADCKPELCCEGSMVYTGGDTLVVHFTKEFAEPLFNLDRTTMDSTVLFLKNFYGIYFSTDPVEEGTKGGRLNIFDCSNSEVALTYSSINSEGRRRDTTVFFLLGAASGVMSIDKDKVLPECVNAADSIVCEGLTGLKPYISGPKLRQILDDWMTANNIDADALMISRATLEFPFEYSGTSDAMKTWPDNIFPCRRLRGNSYAIYSAISERYDSTFDDGSINRSLFYYRPDAALFMQALVRADKADVDENFDIWMMPIMEVTTTTGNSSSYSDLDYYNYYASMYGYGYGYGGYGYGGYGYDPYGYGYGYGYDPYMYGGSNSTSSTNYYVDSQSYWMCSINGTGAARHPKLRLTYTVLK